MNSRPFLKKAIAMASQIKAVCLDNNTLNEMQCFIDNAYYCDEKSLKLSLEFLREILNSYNLKEN